MCHSATEGKYIIQLYNNHYGKSIEVLNGLAEEAKKDFPNLKDKDIELVVFGGISKKYHHGIRFVIPESWLSNDVVENYFIWSDQRQLDETLN